MDLDYLRAFQTGIDFIHATPNDLVNKVAENMVILENVAAEVFRLVSHKVNQTPMDIRVNPYLMDLNKKYSAEEHGDGFLANSSIQKDVLKTWFAN